MQETKNIYFQFILIFDLVAIKYLQTWSSTGLGVELYICHFLLQKSHFPMHQPATKYFFH